MSIEEQLTDALLLCLLRTSTVMVELLNIKEAYPEIKATFEKTPRTDLREALKRSIAETTDTDICADKEALGQVLTHSMKTFNLTVELLGKIQPALIEALQGEEKLCRDFLKTMDTTVIVNDMSLATKVNVPDVNECFSAPAPDTCN